MDTYPPPQQFSDIPEYYLGRLIFREELANDACKWVVYDGVRKVRCYSKESARKYCEEQAYRLSLDALTVIDVMQERIMSGVQNLDMIAKHLPMEQRLDLELIALNIRRAAAQLDRFKNLYEYGTKQEDSNTQGNKHQASP